MQSTWPGGQTAHPPFGGLKNLVNNAGGGGPQPFDMPLEKFVWAFELNVFAGFRLCQLCAPLLVEKDHSTILNISSMAGENKNEDMTSYAASKAAVNHLTSNMAFDLGPMDIRVNADRPRRHPYTRAGDRARPGDRTPDARAHAARAPRRGGGHRQRGTLPRLSPPPSGSAARCSRSVSGGTQELE